MYQISETGNLDEETLLNPWLGESGWMEQQTKTQNDKITLEIAFENQSCLT